MPWRCRMIAEPIGANAWLAVRPGDMWFADDVTDLGLIGIYVAPAHTGRRPLIVRLPGPVNFPIYSAASNGGGAWAVDGEAPNVTLRPSINCHGVYHGYVSAGEVTDDVEGRKYTEDGMLIRTGQRT